MHVFGALRMECVFICFLPVQSNWDSDDDDDDDDDDDGAEVRDHVVPRQPEVTKQQHHAISPRQV